MGELDELITRLLRERLGNDAELAVRLYLAYKEKGRRGVLEVINEVLREVGVEVGEGEG
ncbi:MAG: hypothetical protein L7H10_00275 [Vulcanisaeta sp.]|nr:hypothetical protein [Vulcanisaeta sp.]MCG2869161.1 hypothetical protein [Vulcanisaeta sp.]MCG2879816.1 hypothetical protein [Vulcanisaeta sp.]MCG2886522.1 hypothetical protein [Vulcanisaeta sp.]MCG2892191.1 hypothetical protein [Vulcanisaeta sp.]